MGSSMPRLKLTSLSQDYLFLLPKSSLVLIPMWTESYTWKWNGSSQLCRCVKYA